MVELRTNLQQKSLGQTRISLTQKL